MSTTVRTRIFLPVAKLIVDEVYRPNVVQANGLLAIFPKLRLYAPLVRLVPHLEALRPEAVVEGFDVGVVGGLSRPAEVERNA
ncbi:hypothetical protein MEA186_31716 [Mesorhizobium amorphae CCNWGS0123]|uniref:Uncharacterized protein n=1 Tax=Mesorhizobium amorphae CCNWGS0123 TaxID=1082933 RepID=G6YK09_9HYPH|nr:hypothetical protein A6B35_31895 [Mesorhizobium amorphae CCNWGS0123]EHH04181.1 hypothetical protein MEA186_31716 [Mesorhizobium amorphae CCNWGS0123]